MSTFGHSSHAESYEMKAIDLVYFNAGGGHRSAAGALDAVIRELGLPWSVRLLNLFELLDPRDVFRLGG